MLIRLANLVSLFVLIAVCASWARSHYASDVFSRPGVTTRTTLTSAAGTVTFCRETGLPIGYADEPVSDLGSAGGVILSQSPKRLARLGLVWMTVAWLAPAGYVVTSVAIPYWLLALGFAALPLTRSTLKTVRRRRRDARGQCVQCGFDCRATKRQCPECGKPIRRPWLQVDGWPWLFLDPPETEVVTTVPVVEDRLPILVVAREDDGLWQFLCGTTVELPSLRMTTLAQLFRKDPSIAVVHDLELGWIARRSTPTSPWIRERYAKG